MHRGLLVRVQPRRHLIPLPMFGQKSTVDMTWSLNKIAGSFTVHNDSALSMAEALVTFVLRPDDTSEALEYFQTYTDEELRLDDLYMSHAKLEHTLSEIVHNSIEGTDNGRSNLVLLAQCPLYSSKSKAWTSELASQLEIGIMMVTFSV